MKLKDISGKIIAACNDPLSKRMYMFLEDGDFQKADEYSERVLDTDPENALAYLGKLCAELKINDPEELNKSKETLDTLSSYKRIIQYADSELRAEIEGYNKTIIDRIAKEEEQRKKLPKGSIYFLGGYDWRVLDVQNGKALLLIEQELASRQYHRSKESITWENSTRRKYLNNEFYDIFSDEEKEMIAETRVVNNNNPWYGTDGGNDTIDRIFLLSIEEVMYYLGDSGDLSSRKGWYWEDGKYMLKDGKGWLVNDGYNSERVLKDMRGGSVWWWLRSPGGIGSYAAFVYNDGSINLNGNRVDVGSYGIRPALWINLVS